MARAHGRLAALVAAVTTVLAACGSGGHAERPARARLGPAQILIRSRRILDGTSAVHFQLSSTNVPSGGSSLLSGSGDLVRPDELQGGLLVSEDGASVTIKVVATGGKFWIQLPLSSKYVETNPKTFGLGDPADLLDQNDGISAILTRIKSPARQSSARIDGELLDVVTGTVPGDKVPVLPVRDTAKAVKVTAYVSPSDYQLRRVELVGPFVKAGVETTYDVTLTRYGEHVSISAPPS